METSAWAMSFARANSIYNLAVIGLVIGAVITIVSTITLIWVAQIKDGFANEHVAKAIALSDQAKADAAKANERTAMLLLQAQQIRLEQEKTKALQGWRRVSADQHQKIVKALHGQVLTVVLVVINNDPEAAQFAADLGKTLKDAGATVNSTISMFPAPFRGLGMSMTTSGAGAVLYAALRGAGFAIKDLPERDPVMIFVASKPPAF